MPTALSAFPLLGAPQVPGDQPPGGGNSLEGRPPEVVGKIQRPRHTQPDPRRSQHGRPKCDPTTESAKNCFYYHLCGKWWMFSHIPIPKGDLLFVCGIFCCIHYKNLWTAKKTSPISLKLYKEKEKIVSFRFNLNSTVNTFSGCLCVQRVKETSRKNRSKQLFPAKIFFSDNQKAEITKKKKEIYGFWS